MYAYALITVQHNYLTGEILMNLMGKILMGAERENLNGLLLPYF